MTRVAEGLRDGFYVDGDERYDQIDVNDFPEVVFQEFLNRDPEDDDTRSQVLMFRLPNGDLILGFYPQGDTYVEIERYWG
jgi:hypothetical protein